MSVGALRDKTTQILGTRRAASMVSDLPLAGPQPARGHATLPPAKAEAAARPGMAQILEAHVVCRWC